MAYNRSSFSEFMSLGGPEVGLIRALHRVHGLTYASLNGMRVRGKPVTKSHLRMASDKLKQATVMDDKTDAPSARLLKRKVTAVHLAYLAAIYNKLDPAWVTHRSVDGHYLLSAWEIFVNSIVNGSGPFGPLPRALPDHRAFSAVYLRDLWLTVRAMTQDLIHLVHCPQCGMPRLAPLAASEDSNWQMLSPNCQVCAFRAATRHVAVDGAARMSDAKVMELFVQADADEDAETCDPDFDDAAVDVVPSSASATGTSR